MDLERTIVAVSSGIAAARRAVVRISGNRTIAILEDLLVDNDRPEIVRFLASTRTCHMRLVCDVGLSGRSLPVDCYLWPDSRSFTGERSAELHLNGSLPVIESLVERIVSLGADTADRGEFTLRSFLAGKIDLTQAEAVLGVVEAETDVQLGRALGQLGGNISIPVRELRDELLELTAHLEAGLDFVEEDIEFITSDMLVHRLARINGQLQGISDQLSSRGARSRTASIVLVGRPNAGKSTLLNLLVDNPRAIVSDQAGTTRDAVTATTFFEGLAVELADTAGIEECRSGSPQAIAQRTVRAKLDTADVVLFCVDLSQRDEQDWVDEQRRTFKTSAAVLVVGTKSDLPHDGDSFETDIAVSQQHPDSVSLLKTLVAARLSDAREDLQSSAMHRASLRSREAIDRARASLDRAIDAANACTGEEFVASDLRMALEDLSAIIGEVHTEDILGQIFSRFCIGK